jgi:hypothetical protein
LGVGSITNGDISEGCENLVEEWIEASWNTGTPDAVLINLLCDDLLSAV